MLVVAATGQGDDGDSLTALTYGGQGMTKAVEKEGEDSAGFFAPYTSIWYLKESDLDLASGNSFATTGSLSGGSFRMAAICLDGVDQASPVVDTDTASVFGNTATTNSGLDITLSTEDGGAAISVVAVDVTTGNDGITIAGDFSAGISILTSDGGVSTGVGEVITTDGSSVTADVTVESSNFRANSHSAVTFRSGGDDITLETVDASTSGHSADLSIAKDLSAVSDSVSGSVAAETVDFKLAGTSASTSGQVSDLGLTINASSTSASSSSHNAYLENLVEGSASAASTSTATADADEFSGASASASSTSTATATADPPPPIIPPTPLKDSFLLRQAPVFLIDFEFDGGELNVWTRNFEGEYAGKTYTPLSSISSGFTFQNALGSNVNDSTIQLEGQNQQLINIALTENYRNRLAYIYLGNADGLELEAVELIFPAYIVNMSLTDSRTSSKISITLESIFKRIQSPVIRRQRPADLDKVSDDDSFYDYLETTKVTTPSFGG